MEIQILRQKVSKVRRTGFDPRGSPGVRGNTRTTGGLLPYLSGGLPRRAGRPGIGFGPGRGVATSAGNKGYCSAPLKLLKRRLFPEKGGGSGFQTFQTQGRSGSNKRAQQ